MKRTHITLVGGQPIPVYLGLKHYKPEYVYFICSEQSIQEAERIRNEIGIESELLIIDPVDLQNISSAVEQLSEKLKNTQISINISSGTKPWSYYFISKFSNHKNCEIVYVDQNNLLRNFNDKSQQIVDIDMNTRFRLHNNPLRNYQLLSEYTTEDFEAIERVRQIRRFNFTDFNYLTAQFSRHQQKSFIESKNGSTIKWNKTERSITMQLYNNHGILKSDIFDSPNARNLFINTGWFELEIAHLISKWDKAKEVRLNCIFPTTRNSPKNEIDIIVDTGIKLLFVECKTQINNETDIDKFASAVKIYGGTGSKALFITDAPMRDKALEKCRDNQIIPFSLQPLGGANNAKNKLFQLLNKELYNINTK